MKIVHSAQDVIDKMIPITEYVKLHPNIYFACKALNYRTFAGKWDGGQTSFGSGIFGMPRRINWFRNSVYDKPLMIKGNEVAGRLLQYMKLLNIKTTDDIDDDNAGTDRII